MIQKLVLSSLLIIASNLLWAQPAAPLPVTDNGLLRSQMENARNPALRVDTSLGEFYVELYPEASPLNVERVLQLVTESLGSGYYSGLTVHRSIPGILIQFGDPERAGRPRPDSTVADEINARGLGLEQQSVLDDEGKPHPWLNVADQNDFLRKVMAPLYRDMNINDKEQLRQQQSAVLSRLQTMNLLQLFELRGYRYNGALPSRRPIAGSVLMANYGPDTNDGELVILVQDTPWLTGSHTVIGRVFAEAGLIHRISSEPQASVRIYGTSELD
jgi:cyclophilin family peptidyl-prolyl cis-trans isomerase